MGGTRFGRRKVSSKCGWLAGGLGILLGLAVGRQAFAEEVVIPYDCGVRLGEVRLVRSEPRSYRILGARDRQIYSACDPQDPGQCKNYQVHRFEMDCGGTRVPWLKIAEAAARLDGERVSIKRNQMLLEMTAPEGGRAEPYPDGRWDPDRRNSGDPYGIADGEAVVSFPPGFAPALGVKPIFTGRDPALANQLPPTQGVTSGKGGASGGFGVPYDAADEGGWETQAKGWSQSPRGEPADRDAETGWDADRVIASGEGTPKASAKHSEPAAKANAALAGSKTAGASYGTETVTSQQLPEIGSTKSKPVDAAKKAATADTAKAVQKKPAQKTAEPASHSADTVKSDAPKAGSEKSPTVKVEAKAETKETPTAKAQPDHAAPSKAETSGSTSVAAEATKSEPRKAETTAAASPEPAPAKTETAMLEPPKEQPKVEVTPAAKAEAPPHPAGAAPEAPHMLNGRDAAPAEAAKTDTPSAPLASPPNAPASPAEASGAAPPSTVSASQAPVPPQGDAAAASSPQPAANSAAQSPAGATVVAEATLKPQETHSNIETSSISIVGQTVPVLPAVVLGAAALFTAAGFFFMMRRGEEREVYSYVERDFGRVSLGANGEAASRMAGPSFELPMPGFGEPGGAAAIPHPALSFAAQGLGALDPVVESASAIAPTMAETPNIGLGAMDGVGSDAGLPEQPFEPVSAPQDMVAVMPDPSGADAHEFAPEAVELVRALADPTMQLPDVDDRA